MNEYDSTLSFSLSTTHRLPTDTDSAQAGRQCCIRASIKVEEERERERETVGL